MAPPSKFSLGSNLTVPSSGFVPDMKGVSDILRRTEQLSIVQPDSFMAGSSSVRDSGGVFAAINDAFFNFAALDGTDYNKLFPYQLYIWGPGIPHMSITLPIAPQNISMTVPVASNVTVTMKGLTEDHNGAPLRSIAVQATTGILPQAVLSQARQSSNPALRELQFLARNTIHAVNTAFKQVRNFASMAGGGDVKYYGPLNYDSADEIASVSGYYFFHKLQRFLDYYVALKKTKEGANARLSLLMHKDKMYWDVILNNYSFRKQAGTAEYFYSIQLTAYRRRSDVGQLAPLTPTVEQESVMSQALAVLEQGRKTISAFYGIGTGILADWNGGVITPMREITAFVKDILSIPQTISDLSNSLVQGVKSSFALAMSELDSTLSQAVQPKMRAAGLSSDWRDGDMLGTDGQSDRVQRTQRLAPTVGAYMADSADLSETSELANPIEQLFQHPERYTDILDTIDLNSLPIPLELRENIERANDRIRAFTLQDLQERRDRLALSTSKVAAAIGGGSSTYNRIYELDVPPRAYAKITVESITLLQALNDSVMAMDALISAAKRTDTSPDDDYYQYYAEYATANGIPVPITNSKYYVPFPFGASLESLAVQYLGDVNRWHEIAAINALKEPYIDEEGFEIPFLSNGSGNTAIVADPKHLYVGELIELRSDTQPARIRKIASLERLSAVETIIMFEGDPILSDYRLVDNARIHAFLPNTVNSTRLIAIPSASPVNVPGQIQLAPGVQDLNKIAQIAKRDLLLQSNGDLVFAGNDLRLSTGMTNLIQAILLRLQTRQGDLLHDPQYGNPLQVGQSVAELDLTTILRSLNQQFRDDGRFSGVWAAQLRLDGPAAIMDLLFGVQNTGVNLPVSTNLPL